MASKNETLLKCALLLLSGFVSFCLSVTNYVEHPSFSKFFPQFNYNPDQHLIYFYHSNHSQKVIPLIPDKDILARYVTFRSDNDKFSLTRETYRYSNTFDIILASLPESLEAVAFHDVLMTFIDIVVPSRSVFASSSNEVSTSSAYYLCSGSRVFVPLPFPEFLLQAKSGTWTKLHRALTWNGNRELIRGFIFDSYGYLKSPKEQTRCLQLVKSIHIYCASDIVTLLVLADTHNITVNLFNRDSPGIKQFEHLKHYTNYTTIVSKMSYETYPMPLSFMSAMHFQNFDAESIHYCTKGTRLSDGNTTDLSTFTLTVWIEPFSLKIWAAIFSVIVTVAMIPRIETKFKDSLGNLLSLLANTFGHADSIQRKHILLVCSVAFLFSLHGNGLTSLVTVAPKPKLPKTIKELLNLKYKIMFPFPSKTRNFENQYGYDFEFLGLQDRIQDSFYNTFYHTSTKVIDKLCKSSGWLAFTNILSNSKFCTALYSYDLRPCDKSFVCHTLEQTFLARQYVWTVRAEGRVWLLKTLMQTVESGLSDKWNEWSEWHGMLLYKGLVTENSVTSDNIDFPKFYSAAFVLSLFACIGMVALCFERNPIKLLDRVRFRTRITKIIELNGDT
ncbi:unnamed protein product [Orchesella dallaii]|uniref:Uncharacterized protein n=1 Tax=Orchesella dallaii TaxID=48710 RepID=A0ABP1RLQ3_9HEXA